MNAFGGFIQIGSSETAENFFSAANDFFKLLFKRLVRKGLKDLPAGTDPLRALMLSLPRTQFMKVRVNGTC